MSNELNRVKNRLFKEEVKLESQAVELANVKDISAKLKGIYDWQKKLDKSVPAFEQLQKDIKEQKSMLEMKVKEAENVISEITKQARELGLDPSSFDGFKQLDIEVKNSQSVYLK